MGPLNYRGDTNENFLGYMGGQSREISDETAKIIDQEVTRIVNEGYKTAQDILTKNSEQLENLAQALLEFETLTGEEIKTVISGKTLERAKEQKPKKKVSSFALEKDSDQPSDSEKQA